MGLAQNCDVSLFIEMYDLRTVIIDILGLYPMIDELDKQLQRFVNFKDHANDLAMNCSVPIDVLMLVLTGKEYL